MALDANAKMANIKASLDDYCRKTLGTSESLSIDYEGLPFDNASVLEWVMPRIVDTIPTFHRQGSNSQYGEDVNILFHTNIFVKKGGQTTAVRHYIIRDAVASHFRIKQDIPIKNFAAGGEVIQDNMRVRRIVTDAPLAATGFSSGRESGREAQTV